MKNKSKPGKTSSRSRDQDGLKPERGGGLEYSGIAKPSNEAGSIPDVSVLLPTEPSTILLRNPRNDVHEQHKIIRSSDLKALKIMEGPVGMQVTESLNPHICDLFDKQKEEVTLLYALKYY